MTISSDNKMKKTEVIKCETLGKLPELLAFNDGRPVRTPVDWEERRSELFKTAVELQYGELPPKPEEMTVQCLYAGGPGEANSYRVTVSSNGYSFGFLLKLFLPMGAAKPPVIVNGDLCFNYLFDKSVISSFLDNNIALAVFDRTEIADDKEKNPVRTGRIYNMFPDRKFGSIAAWAWGYSRCVDALEKIELTDKEKIIFSGHSRGGKTSMLAGITDRRAAIIHANETNAGSCSCYRIHLTAKDEYGEIGRSETLKDMTENFPTWLSDDMKKYADKEKELPFDCHFLKALAAPRTLLISEAASDIWGNPVGSIITSKEAQKAYELLNAENELLWYVRSGRHGFNSEDAEQLLNVIQHKWYGINLNDRFFKSPF